MLTLMSFVESEDYWNINNINTNNLNLDYYAYTFEVVGGSESEGASSVKVIVVELINAKIAIGYILPSHLKLEGEFKIGFICQDKPTDDISFICRLSNEVKRATYNGDDLEKLEYIGFSLEKFYDSKSVRYYMQDLRGVPSENK